VLLAGAASGVITPPLPFQLAGHQGRRIASAVADDLSVRALCLSDGASRWIVIAVELLWLERAQVASIRQIVRELTGLPADNVLVACTHTHSGPDTLDWYEFVPRVDQGWLDALPTAVARVAAAAAAQLEPASLATGAGRHSLGVQRRLPTPDGIQRRPNSNGAVDEGVRVVSLRDASGNCIASVINLALHPVLLGVDSRVVSGDWCGATARHVERALGGTCLVLNGACGDNNPRLWTNVTYEEMASVGDRVAEEAVRALTSCRATTAHSVVAARKELLLPSRPHPYLKVAQGRRLKQDGGLHTEVQALRVGPVRLVGMPGEVLFQTVTESRLAAASVGEFLLWIGYANDYIGYLSTPRVFEEGGYEASATMTDATGTLALVAAAEALVDTL
jgi:neutral ceramidase